MAGMHSAVLDEPMTLDGAQREEMIHMEKRYYERQNIATWFILSLR